VTGEIPFGAAAHGHVVMQGERTHWKFDGMIAGYAFVKHRPILVGQAPGPRGDPRKPLSGRSGAYLEGLAGVPLGSLPERADLVNVLRKFPGRSSSRGDLFPFSLARPAALRLARRQLDQRPVVLCGRSVAEAFGLGRVPFFAGVRAWRVMGKESPVFDWEFLAVVIPHPSGVNRSWNNAWQRELGQRFMTALIGDDHEQVRMSQLRTVFDESTT
jgi:hypothetical protein